jgi:glycosyltransferase involved in cell wall biosynthesis
MVRIGILAKGFMDWGGGVDFLRIITTSLRVAAPEIELHILFPDRGSFTQFRNLRNWARAKFCGATVAHPLSFGAFEDIFADTGVVIHRINLGSYAVATASRNLLLDALIPAINPQSIKGVPWVGYIADFQHRKLPQFFTDRECAKRDQAFSRMLNKADAVIVNAQDVARDIERYHPNSRARVFVMPFSPALPSDAPTEDPQNTARRYNINGPYLIICNQFWIHKDHDTAFKAFALIANRHPDLLLVCTGITSDYRFPHHFDKLIQRATQDGIAHRILALGLIPKYDQLSLIRGAIALIQPTLFEGGPGGGAVYDAVALGKRAIVSDIPVNTEIDEPTITYYKARDVDALAEAMESTLINSGISAIEPEASELVRRGFERRRACGLVLLEALSYVVKLGYSRRLGDYL